MVEPTKEQAEYIMKNRYKFLKIYNSMCNTCRGKCLQKPDRPVTDYCVKCQIMFSKILTGEPK